MGSLFGDWPSYDPHNFTQLRPSDPSNPSRLTPATYHPTHDRTLPPPDQVISTESKNILIRHFYKHAEDKVNVLSFSLFILSVLGIKGNFDSNEF
ncbi:hypothetical protein KSS87_001096 [Heliosperma pusillum]|nr:hypothetical protein KSS87_001096 [Heliosperma pusillum]